MKREKLFDKEKLSELEANNLCDYLGFDFTLNSDFDEFLTLNEYIQVWNNDIQEYEYIKSVKR
jgi:hypothetical protein